MYRSFRSPVRDERENEFSIMSQSYTELDHVDILDLEY